MEKSTYQSLSISICYKHKAQKSIRFQMKVLLFVFTSLLQMYKQLSNKDKGLSVVRSATAPDCAGETHKSSLGPRHSLGPLSDSGFESTIQKLPVSCPN